MNDECACQSCTCDDTRIGPIERFTLVAADTIEIATVEDFTRPITLTKGQSLTFVSADTLYIRAARDEQPTTDGGRDG